MAGIIGTIWAKLFGKKGQAKSSNLQTINLFSPNFSSEAKAEMNATFISAVNAHARHLSKIQPRAYLNDEPAQSRKYLDRILGLAPNYLMNAPRFWKAVATSYFMDNLSILWLEWDYSSWKEPLKGIWPLDTSLNSLQIATDDSGRVVVKFIINGKTEYEWLENLVVLQREANISDLFKGRSKAIDQSIQVLQTSYEGLELSVKTSQFIRFLVLSQTNLSDENVQKRQDEVSKRIFGNKSGIAYFPNAEKVQEVTSNGKWPLAPELDSIKSDIYSYLSITPEIVKGKYTEDEWQAYYESALEPFCAELAAELTTKIFNQTEISLGNRIRIITDPLQTASIRTRISIATAMQKLPMVVPNNIARLLYQPEIEGGDKPQASLNFVKGTEQSKYQTGDPGEDEPTKEEDPNADTNK